MTGDVSITGDLSLNVDLNVGGNASINAGIYIAGDVSWNPASSIAANSIPQSAIIGGVGSNDFTGDISVKTGFIKQF
jgi:hypothetical protein